MDTKKLKQYIEDIKKQKNIKFLIVILLIVIMIYFIVSYFLDVNNISNGKEAISYKTDSNVSNTDKGEGTEKKSYEKEQEESLKNILKQIDGVGNVDVRINFEGSEIKVPAVDNNNQKSTTVENDSEGGKRESQQETEGGKVVMSGSEPFILKTDKPKITGAMIVAEGAENSKIKYEISKAVSSLYDISMDKVTVLPMQKNNNK